MPPHIAVVGAGIVGASIAFHLALRGARVTLIDSAAPGSGASAVSFAWLNARDKTPRHYHALNRRPPDLWDRFARRLDADLGLSWGGEWRWAVTVEGGDQIAHRVHELQSWGYPIQLLDDDALAVLEPGLTPGAVTAAGPNQWIAIVALGLFPLAIGHTLYNTAVRLTSPTYVNLIATQEVIGGIALSAIFLGEQLTWPALTGAILTLAGVTWVIARR